MKLSEQLKQDNYCGDFGNALAGYAERAEELERDAARYRWLRDQLMSADFNYQDSGACALVFAWPKDCAVSANCDAMIDAAMLKTPNARANLTDTAR